MSKDLVRALQVLFPHGRQALHDLRWCPAADVYRTRDGWLVKLDVAGVQPADITVTAQGRKLTVRGRRRDWCRDEDCSCYMLEIAYSEFERTLTLPCRLDDSKIHADYRDGMLLVRIQTEEAHL